MIPSIDSNLAVGSQAYQGRCVEIFAAFRYVQLSQHGILSYDSKALVDKRQIDRVTLPWRCNAIDLNSSLGKSSVMILAGLSLGVALIHVFARADSLFTVRY